MYCNKIYVQKSLGYCMGNRPLCLICLCWERLFVVAIASGYNGDNFKWYSGIK